MAGSVPAELAVGGLFGLWDTVWPYLMMLAGFSLIVFVHELGHFAIAKWAGVRVERFAVGFGRELFGFTRGETRYSFNALPLGGYVKMLGQEDFDDKTNELRFKEDPRSFANKPVGHRMAIVSGGVIMNILFAILLFMIVFMVGIQSEAPRLAEIEPDSPAEKAGLQPGDIVRKINGDRILEFKEVRYAVMLAAPHEPLEFIVERDGRLLPPFYLTPEYQAPEGRHDVQRQIVGIKSGFTRKIVILGPEIDVSREDQPHVGDLLVEVDGMAVTNENASQVFSTLTSAKGDIFVERKDPKDPDAPPRRVRVDIPPVLSLQPSEPGDPRTVSVLGLTPLAKFAGVDDRGRAYYAGLRVGDTVLSWDDKTCPSAADIALSVIDNAERDIPFSARRANGERFMGFVRPRTHERGPATIQAVQRPIEGVADADRAPRARLEYVRPGGIAARAGIAAGDVIVSVEGKEFPTSVEVNTALRNGLAHPVSITVRKADGSVAQAVVVPQTSGSIDANFSLVADDVLVVGDAVEMINGRRSPASEAGIPSGVRITSLNGQAVTKWRELIDRFREFAGTTVQMSFKDPSGASRTVPFRVPGSLHTLLGVGPEARILTIDGRDSITVTEGDRTATLSLLYREGIREVLKTLVGRKQVPVEYRANSFAEKKTAHVDVTEDMVDPWLTRVAFLPNVQPGAETVLLRGKNVIDAMWIGLHKTYYFMYQIYTILDRMIFTRSMGLETMSGPLGIFGFGGQVARADFLQFIFFLAMISANLAVINFLPLPIVDGGLMVFLIIEKIKGSPVSLRVQIATQTIGLVLIVSTFVFVTYQDALRLFG